MTTVFLAGGFGKMGLAIQQLIENEADLELVGILSGSLHESELPVFTSLADIDVTADVWVDVTQPEAAFANGQYALTHGFQFVVGTSGLQAEQLAALKTLSEKENRATLVVPNFSLSGVLLMQFAAQAAKYLPDAEILEIHNPKKVDAPSGTARATAQAIAKSRQADPVKTNIKDPARGDQIDNVTVHAMRLPGYVAEEEVIFGAPGETLRIKQTSFTRESFMGGVALAIRQINTIQGLQVGLDKVL
ncbi:4-hydroxy-tetrahydrodipicolinate reductase [Weissella paramesenteroides]|uniref:4-hydroxy-tetrahydrodipicolinate reductase n=1 Tax=Weissella paramesenteroides TaxID=1249 RepID=UPI0013DACE27|nr:4-hydroxy-tetrahydrodipicolinate reductase [Weissella paramesenteroides]MBU7557401.1 4-hydroxy-tetrahydrodipicolinate reductase [Weissella paramesenteroides]NEZ88620.1 4-hydroxy-tetrahydrodipicolinate reductase [Weissella paramesenteroides]NFB02946.1 4-hydroxy-tetrahydrodipicolinate reductase [Weissella paramesenteroides]